MIISAFAGGLERLYPDKLFYLRLVLCLSRNSKVFSFKKARQKAFFKTIARAGCRRRSVSLQTIRWSTGFSRCCLKGRECRKTALKNAPDPKRFGWQQAVPALSPYRFLRVSPCRRTACKEIVHVTDFQQSLCRQIPG